MMMEQRDEDIRWEMEVEVSKHGDGDGGCWVMEMEVVGLVMCF